MDLSKIDIMGPELTMENPVTVHVGDLIFYLGDTENETRTNTGYPGASTEEFH